MQSVVVGALLIASLISPSNAEPTCNGTSSWNGCSVVNSGTSVDVSGNSSQSGTDSGETGASDSTNGSDVPPPSPSPTPTCAANAGPRDTCRGFYAAAMLAFPDVTLNDLASFTPARPSLAGEPDGVGVVGMSTNLVAAASEQQLTGPLLGYDVTVRFTPAAYRFSYGDGSTQTSSTGGASWTALGQAEFTPTATSHVYRAKGTYTTSVTVLYSAAVNFGTGTWRPVPGYVEATTGGYRVRIVEVHTALVDKTCLENPRGPGC